MSTTFLDGYIVGTPDFKPVGEKTCIKFSISCRAKYKKDKTDNTKKHYSFFDIEYWPYEAYQGKTKDEIIKIQKGNHVCFEAEPLQDRWEDKDGNKRGKVFFNVNGDISLIVPKDTGAPTSNTANFEDDEIPF